MQITQLVVVREGRVVGEGGGGGGGHSETENIVLPIKPTRLTEDLFQLDSHIGFSFLYFHPKHSLLVNMH